MTLQATPTDEHAAYELLATMTTDTHEFSVPTYEMDNKEKQRVLDRLKLMGWIRLIDIVWPSNIHPLALRVFHVTPDAVAWYAAQRAGREGKPA